MKTSEQVNEISAALAKAQGQYTPVPKKKTAKVKTKAGYEYSYKYADWADVLEMALPVLSANNLALTQFMLRNVEGVYLQSRLLHSSGQWIESDGLLITQEADKQSMGSELSYNRRYDGCSILGIMPDEDEDGKIATDNAKAEKKQASPPSPKTTVEAPETAQAIPIPMPSASVLSQKDRKILFDDCYRLGANNEHILQAVKKVTGQDSSKLVTYAHVQRIKEESYKLANPPLIEIPQDVKDAVAGEVIP